MSQFFISCKESRIESNRSFYGCFYLGPFEPSQSITIANALRRTLLSELFGLGMVSVEIEGATHEYSSLPGVKDSVLDILLNLKEIVFKKTLKNFKPQVGYLRVRGPGVVRASHLRLPPFIQCVDPDQYIATLADNGFLNMKFIIQYGNKWLSPMNSLGLSEGSSTRSSNMFMGENLENSKEDNSVALAIPARSTGPFNLHLRKRRLILKKLKQLGIASSNFYINIIARNAQYLSKYIKKRTSLRLRSESTSLLLSKTFGLKPLRVKQLKMIKSIYEKNKAVEARKYSAINLKNTVKKLSKSNLEKKSNLLDEKSHKFLRGNNKMLPARSSDSRSTPLTIDAIFNPINKVNYIIEQNQHRLTPSKIKTASDISELYEMLKNTDLLNSSFQKNSVQEPFSSEQFASRKEFEDILEIKRDIDALKKEITKHNITLEIWTNGSIHPRDALYQGFKNLIKVFATLKNVKMINLNTSNAPAQNVKLNNLKKLKMGETNSTLPLLPLNETSFLSTYVSPKLKNYYLNNNNLILENPQIHSGSSNPSPTVRLPNNVTIIDDLNTSNSNGLSHSAKQINKDLSNLDIGILNLSLHSYASLKRLKINTLEELVSLVKNYEGSTPIRKNQLSSTALKEIESRIQPFL